MQCGIEQAAQGARKCRTEEVVRGRVIRISLVWESPTEAGKRRTKSETFGSEKEH